MNSREDAGDRLSAEHAELVERIKTLESDRRPWISSGFGEDGIGLAMAAIAGAIAFASFRRKQTEAR